MLGDAITAALPELQSAALSRMTDRCIIREPDSWVGEVLTAGAVAWQYAGVDEIPCRIKMDNTEPKTVVVGGEVETIVRLTVALPLEVCPVVGQIITVVWSAQDPSLVGRMFDVLAAGVGSQVTARRVSCQEHR
jgi:hypothetical protein